MASHQICILHARLEHDEDMARFMAQIPNSDSLAAVLRDRHVVSTRAYDDDAEVARFVRSDGLAVICLGVDGVTIDEAEMIAAQVELLDDWSDEKLIAAVHLALADDELVDSISVAGSTP